METAASVEVLGKKAHPRLEPFRISDYSIQLSIRRKKKKRNMKQNAHNKSSVDTARKCF